MIARNPELNRDWRCIHVHHHSPRCCIGHSEYLCFRQTSIHQNRWREIDSTQLLWYPKIAKPMSAQYWRVPSSKATPWSNLRLCPDCVIVQSILMSLIDSQTTRELDSSNSNSSMLLHAVLLAPSVLTAGNRPVAIVQNPQRNPHPDRVEEKQVQPREHPAGSVEVRTAAQPFLV